MLLLIGVSPIVSLCHGIIGHVRLRALRMVEKLSEVVSMLSELEVVGVGDGGGEGFDCTTWFAAPLIRGRR